MAEKEKEQLTGIQKAAILLIALGPEKSSLIFKHLKEEEIDSLIEDILYFSKINKSLEKIKTTSY